MLRARRARDPPEAGGHGRKAVHGGVGGPKRGRKAERLGAIPHMGAAEADPKTPKNGEEKFSEFTKTLTCGKCGTPPTPLYNNITRAAETAENGLSHFSRRPFGLA